MLFLVFLDELLVVGAGVAELLLAGVENDLPQITSTTFCDIFKSSFKYTSIHISPRLIHINTTNL